MPWPSITAWMTEHVVVDAAGPDWLRDPSIPADRNQSLQLAAARSAPPDGSADAMRYRPTSTACPAARDIARAGDGADLLVGQRQQLVVRPVRRRAAANAERDVLGETSRRRGRRSGCAGRCRAGRRGTAAAAASSRRRRRRWRPTALHALRLPARGYLRPTCGYGTGRATHRREIARRPRSARPAGGGAGTA